MSDSEDLDYERNINLEYQQAVTARQESLAIIHQNFKLESKQLWNEGFKVSASVETTNVIAGRVSLVDGTDGLPPDFYVGPAYVEVDDLLIVSFAAPVASLFFKGRDSSDRDSSRLQGRRSFVAQGTDLVDYSDDLEDKRDSRLVFKRNKSLQLELEIPVAPSSVKRPTFEHVDESASVSKDAVLDDAQSERLDQLRGKEAVLTALEAPKTGELGSLLGTLQEDQFDIVTRDPRLPIIVQGNPGAGKTVVALHRAAYLTHSEHNRGQRRGQQLPLETVGVIGPTSDYVSHVLGTPGRVGGGKVAVMSIDGLLANLAGLSMSDPIDSTESHESSVSTSDRFAIALELVVQLFKDSYPGHLEIEIVVNQLVGDNDEAEDYFIEVDPEEGARYADFLRQFASWSDAKRHRQNAGWLAVVGLALGTAPQFNFDHLIVDEAQDLSPLMWYVLRSVLRPGGGMSVFGDINQRRNDFSWSTWDEVAVSVPLGLPADSQGLSELEVHSRSSFPIVELTVGYRSTIEIQEFANSILPVSERVTTALRHGPEPEVIKVSVKILVPTAVEWVEKMSLRYASGVSSLICPDQDFMQSLGDELRRLGWRTRPGTRERHKEGRRLSLLLPDQARGLEFDSVIVVEPGRFPGHTGGMRVLYTSLTRANQELVVLHSQALPKPLRK